MNVMNAVENSMNEGSKNEVINYKNVVDSDQDAVENNFKDVVENDFEDAVENDFDDAVENDFEDVVENNFKDAVDSYSHESWRMMAGKTLMFGLVYKEIFLSY